MLIAQPAQASVTLTHRNGHTYLYNSQTKKYMTGQQHFNNKWYLFAQNSGIMQTGLQRISNQNKTVYYAGNGQMQYGQQYVNGKWYLFKTGNGAMQTGLQRISNQNKTVYYAGNGQMQYGQQYINGKWYLFNTGNGAMKTGFQTISNQHKTVYYNGNGQMLYGWQQLNGQRYYFNTKTGNKEQTAPITNSESSLVTNSKTAKKAQQIVTVIQNGSSTATLRLWQKSGNTWQNKLTVSSRLGASGIGYSSEVSSKTPIGTYHLSFAFGKAGSVRTGGINYRQIKSNTYWIEDQHDKQYNSWQNRSWANNKNEHLIDYTKAAPHNQYQLAVVMDNHGQNNGSGFFIHVRNQWATEGCVAISYNDLQTLVGQLGKNAYVINVQNLNQLKNY